MIERSRTRYFVLACRGMTYLKATGRIRSLHNPVHSRWSRRGIWEWNFDAAGCYRRQTYDCEKVRQQIKDEGALPVIPAAAMSPIKPTVRSASTAAAIAN